MFGRRAGLFSALAAVMLLLGGCGNAGANLGGTMDGYNNGRYANGGAVYWDGYGINSGRSMENHPFFMYVFSVSHFQKEKSVNGDSPPRSLS